MLSSPISLISERILSSTLKLTLFHRIDLHSRLNLFQGFNDIRLSWSFEGWVISESSFNLVSYSYTTETNHCLWTFQPKGLRQWFIFFEDGTKLKISSEITLPLLTIDNDFFTPVYYLISTEVRVFLTTWFLRTFLMGFLWNSSLQEYQRPTWSTYIRPNY